MLWPSWLCSGPKNCQLCGYFGNLWYFLLPYLALALRLSIDGKHETWCFFNMKTQDHAILKRLAPFLSSHLIPKRRKKNYLDVAGIVPRWDSATTRRSIHNTAASQASKLVNMLASYFQTFVPDRETSCRPSEWRGEPWARASTWTPSRRSHKRRGLRWSASEDAAAIAGTFKGEKYDEPSLALGKWNVAKT